ncbi:acyl-ACP desaturase [Candidatus Saccharibacteria bacterium]|nr:acyl-ACP desaturase [Candidatus Saccharibacteria bacterium]
MSERVVLPLNESDQMFMAELSPEIERLLDQHIASPREFYPYDFVEEMDEAIKTGDYVPEDAPLSPIIIASLEVNLLTEDGLPYYTETLLRGLPKKHPFRDWIYRWTAEEGRHGPTIANWLNRTQQVDMRQLERDRMTMMTNPDTPQPGSFIEGIAYPAFQEPATEVSHRNTMRLLPSVHKIGKKALASVVGDEVKHGKFKDSLMEEALKVNPSLAIRAIARQMTGFRMPGLSIPGFKEKAAMIANAGIFDAKQLHSIFERLTTKWKISERSGLTPEAEKAQVKIFRRISAIGKYATQEEELRLAQGRLNNF